jgi:cyanophycinase-like exopeptidase
VTRRGAKVDRRRNGSHLSKGARHVTILQTRDRNVANSESFVSMLRTARGV